MREKLEFWRNEWKKRGYSDDEIPEEPGSQPLPPVKPQQPAAQVSQKVKKKVRSKDVEPSKNALIDLERYRREEERKQKMELIGREGEALMLCVKVSNSCFDEWRIYDEFFIALAQYCIKHSYALEEIALAYKKCGKRSKEEVLAYLQRTWAQSVR